MAPRPLLTCEAQQQQPERDLHIQQRPDEAPLARLKRTPCAREWCGSVGGGPMRGVHVQLGNMQPQGLQDWKLAAPCSRVKSKRRCRQPRKAA